MSKAVAKKLELGKSRVLARGKKTITAAGTARVKLKVVKRARARLRKQKRVKVTLRVRTTIAGVTTPVSRKITLSADRRRSRGQAAAPWQSARVSAP